MARGVEEEVAWRYFCRDVVPFTAMVAVECVTVGANTLFKAATMRGLSFYVFVFYNYVIATLVLLPLSLLFRRSRRLPSAKSSVFFKIFLLALVGFMSVVAGCKGLEYSSPTLASAISNLTPAFTFTLAIIFRMEQVVLRSSATQAKIIGTIVSMSGALVVVLYKGPKILASSTTVSHDQHLTISESSWIIGGLLIAAQYLLVSIWLILQTRIMEVYPEEINVVFLYNLCATLISAPVCLFATKDLSSFLLKPGLPLASVMFSGGLVSSLGSVIHTWGLHLKGPVYISLFKPLSIVIAVAMGSIFLGDALYLGSVVGSVILSLGFYTVIWGKSREGSTRTVAVYIFNVIILKEAANACSLCIMDETLSTHKVTCLIVHQFELQTSIPLTTSLNFFDLAQVIGTFWNGEDEVEEEENKNSGEEEEVDEKSGIGEKAERERGGILVCVVGERREVVSRRTDERVEDKEEE
uniref:EamA domain-containing protein n=1 Tax=Brassica campestris TaxID=3711 RepID=M4EI35_BRACM